VKRLIIRIIESLLALLVFIVLGGLGWRALRQHQVAKAMAISAALGIDERRFIRIGGLNQWIVIRGQNRDNPAILILHGGPGAADSPLESLFLAWEHDFTIVQ
jgi:hypothetical protein